MIKTHVYQLSRTSILQRLSRHTELSDGLCICPKCFALAYLYGKITRATVTCLGFSNVMCSWWVFTETKKQKGRRKGKNGGKNKKEFRGNIKVSTELCKTKKKKKYKSNLVRLRYYVFLQSTPSTCNLAPPPATPRSSVT